MTRQQFTATVRGNDHNAAASIPLPFDPKAEFGSGRAAVVVTVDAKPPFRTTVGVFDGAPVVGLRTALQAELGIGPGSVVRVVIELDEAPRTVEVPVELEQAFEDAPDARAAYDALAYSHRKEYARWVGEAKKEQTRLDRAGTAVARLVAGSRTPR